MNLRLRSRAQERQLQAAIACGRKLIRQGKDHEALEFLEDTVRLVPKSAEVRCGARQGISRPSADDMAVQVTKAAELGTDDPAVQVHAAHMPWNCDDLEGARRCAVCASERVDDDFILSADLEGLIGRVAARESEYTFAEEKLCSALRREPQDPTHAIRLARFLWARGEMRTR